MTDCWFIYCGDIHAGTIARATACRTRRTTGTGRRASIRARIPARSRSGCAETFEEARAKLSAGMAGVRSEPQAERDFAEWREWQDWTARKYAARDAGLPCPMR